MARNFLQAIVFVLFSVNTELTLRELERTAGFWLTVFFTFNNAAVTGQEPCGFQRATQRWIVQLQRFGNAVLNCTRLTGQTTARNGCHNVELIFDTSNLEWLTQDHLQNRACKICGHFFTVYSYFA